MDSGESPKPQGEASVAQPSAPEAPAVPQGGPPAEQLPGAPAPEVSQLGEPQQPSPLEPAVPAPAEQGLSGNTSVGGSTEVSSPVQPQTPSTENPVSLHGVSDAVAQSESPNAAAQEPAANPSFASDIKIDAPPAINGGNPDAASAQNTFVSEQQEGNPNAVVQEPSSESALSAQPQEGVQNSADTLGTVVPGPEATSQSIQTETPTAIPEQAAAPAGDMTQGEQSAETTSGTAATEPIHTSGETKDTTSQEETLAPAPQTTESPTPTPEPVLSSTPFPEQGQANDVSSTAPTAPTESPVQATPEVFTAAMPETPAVPEAVAPVGEPQNHGNLSLLERLTSIFKGNSDKKAA